MSPRHPLQRHLYISQISVKETYMYAKFEYECTHVVKKRANIERPIYLSVVNEICIFFRYEYVCMHLVKEHICLCVCVSVWLFGCVAGGVVYVSVCLCICVSVCLCACVPMCPCVWLSLWLCVRMSVCLCGCVSVCLFVCVAVCPCVYLSVWLFWLCVSVSLCLHSWVAVIYIPGEGIGKCRWWTRASARRYQAGRTGGQSQKSECYWMLYFERRRAVVSDIRHDACKQDALINLLESQSWCMLYSELGSGLTFENICLG